MRRQCRDRHGDRRTPDSAQPANLEQARRQHRAGVARGHDGLGLAFPHRTAGADERAVRLAADRVGRLLVHRDHIGRLDQLEALRVEARRTDDDRDDVVRACVERAGDDLLRAAIPSHRVDRDADHDVTERRCGAARRRGRGTCGTGGRPGGAASDCRTAGRCSTWAPRCRAARGACRGAHLEVFFLGTAMDGAV